MKIILSFLVGFILLGSNSSLNNNTKLEITGKKIALLVSVEDTDLTDDYDNTATQDADLYRDNIVEALEDKDFDDIEKMSNPTGKEFLELFKRKIEGLDKNDLFVFYYYGG